ncbi:DUF5625 family protein [Methylobacterium sp. Leaf399]|uniref:DUF5625 family protein n=1 Tax=Methylobacterium sp. Leaf399 TaxID=1736364 RepID=UPI0012E33076|nr:DUF5625 family protein [Methylobacterium sp. Leaf399]
MSRIFSRLAALNFPLKILFCIFALALVTITSLTLIYIANDNGLTSATSVPADFVVSDWKKPQVFSIRVRDNNSFAIVLYFRFNSALQRESVLKRFSDRVPGGGSGDNEIISFEVQIHNNNGTELVKRTIKTHGISFHSKGEVGRLIDIISLDRGNYSIKLYVKNDETLYSYDTMVSIKYLTK